MTQVCSSALLILISTITIRIQAANCGRTECYRVNLKFIRETVASLERQMASLRQHLEEVEATCSSEPNMTEKVAVKSVSALQRRSNTSDATVKQTAERLPDPAQVKLMHSNRKNRHVLTRNMRPRHGQHENTNRVPHVVERKPSTAGATNKRPTNSLSCNKSALGAQPIKPSSPTIDPAVDKDMAILPPTKRQTPPPQAVNDANTHMMYGAESRSRVDNYGAQPTVESRLQHTKESHTFNPAISTEASIEQDDDSRSMNDEAVPNRNYLNPDMVTEPPAARQILSSHMFPAPGLPRSMVRFVPDPGHWAYTGPEKRGPRGRGKSSDHAVVGPHRTRKNLRHKYNRTDPDFQRRTGRKIILLGGYYGTNILDSVEEYVPSTPVRRPYSEIDELPEPRYGHTAAAINGEIYVSGGYRSQGRTLDTALLFEPYRQDWLYLSTMKHARGSPAGTVARNRFYVCGGWDGRLSNSLRSCEYYQRRRNEWIGIRPMQIRRNRFALVASRGFLMAIGGLPLTRTVEIYDPTLNQWGFVAPIRRTRFSHSAAVLNDEVYVCGGHDGLSRRSRTCEKYIPEKDEWIDAASMAIGRSDFALVSFNGQLYAFGGYSSEVNNATSVEMFDPIRNLWSPAVSLRQPRQIFAAVDV